MKRLAVFVALALAGLGAFAASASACSCAWKPDADRFTAAEAAFVGTLVEHRVVGEFRAVQVYRVDEVHKGAFGETVEIHTAESGGTCGLSNQLGNQVALYPVRRNGVWDAGACDVGSVAGMRAAAAKAAPPSPRRARALRARSRWTALCLRALAWSRP